MADDRHGADLSPRPQLRIAALLAVLTLLFVPLQAYYLEPAALLKVAPFYVFAAAFGLAIASLVAGVVTVAASARVMDRFRASLAQRQDELAAFSTRLMSVHEEERRRVARELHEELGSSLTAILSYLWLFDRHRPEDVETLQSRAADARRIVTKPKNGDAGTGLIGIRERVRALGGSVALTSGSGAHLRVRLPAAGKRAMRA